MTMANEPTTPAFARPPGTQLAWIALGLGLLHAAFSVYWGLGGTWMLDTIGGEIERQARAGDRSMLAVVWIAAGLKIVAALAGPLAIRPDVTSRWHRLVRFVAWSAAVILILYGGVQTITGTLVALGVIEAAPGANMRAIAWHAFFWQPWFLLWGLALAGALWLSRDDNGTTTETPDAGRHAPSGDRPVVSPR